MEGFGIETYGERYGEALTAPDVTAAVLAELAGPDRRALELAVGTGRIALPLAALGVEVTGHRRLAGDGRAPAGQARRPLTVHGVVDAARLGVRGSTAMTAWPLFGLRVVTPTIELRYPDDALAERLAALTLEPIHDPAVMPFGLPWTDAPVEERARNTLQYLWRERGALTPESWSVPLAVLDGDEVVGIQTVLATGFATLRAVETGSWLIQAAQGRGIGTTMRRAVLHLAFAGFGAEVATTAAWHDNGASLGVTTKLGYEPNGEDVLLRREAADRMLRYRMTRARWVSLGGNRVDHELHGVEACLPLLGAG